MFSDHRISVTKKKWNYQTRNFIRLAFFRHSCHKWIVVSILFIINLTKTFSQETCSCSPSVFTFQLDFSLTCPPENVDVGSNKGIDAIFCQTTIEPFKSEERKSSPLDLVPVSISQISIFELDNQLSVIKQSFLSNLDLVDGDYYSYLSITDNYKQGSFDSNDIPGGLQVLLKGKNANGIGISNSFILTYTNSCESVPFQIDDSIGWNVFVGIKPSPSQLCPLYTDIPSLAPTLKVTPSIKTAKPILSPTIAPTLSPTIAPIMAPTIAPTIKDDTLEPTMSFAYDWVLENFNTSYDYKDSSDYIRHPPRSRIRRE